MPFLEPITLALTVSITLDHKPARIPQVSVQPLVLRHGDECGKQGDHRTHVHETGDDDNLARRSLLNRWNCGGFTGDGRLIESGGWHGGGRRIDRPDLVEVRVDVDDERRANSREQTRLWGQVRCLVGTDDISKTAQASTRVPSGTFGNRLANTSFVNSERFSDVRWYSGLHVITAFPRLQLSHGYYHPGPRARYRLSLGLIYVRWKASHSNWARCDRLKGDHLRKIEK